jgi:hypothetical protein
MNKTFDRIKYGAGLAASAAFSFIKINLLGALSTGLAVVVMFLLMSYQGFGDGPGPAHASGWATIVVLFTMRPIAFILAVAILFVSPFALFALGNKYILMKTAGRMIKDKGEPILYPLIDAAVLRIRQGQPELLRKGGDTLKTKLHMIQAVKDSNENRWTKRITMWGLKKADLHDVDFGAEDLSIMQTIRDRVVSALHTFSTPSRKFFWSILAIQWCAVVLTLVQLI